MGLLLLAGRSIQHAQSMMAVGLERAHTEGLGLGERLAVVDSSRVGVRVSAMRGNRAEELQGIRVVTTFLVPSGMRQRLLGADLCLLQAVG